MRPLYVLIVLLRKLPESALRESSKEFRIENVELRKVCALQTVFGPAKSLTTKNTPPAVDFLANQHGQTSLTVTPLFVNLDCFIMSFRGNDNLMQLAGMRSNRLVINRVGIRSRDMLS